MGVKQQLPYWYAALGLLVAALAKIYVEPKIENWFNPPEQSTDTDNSAAEDTERAIREIAPLVKHPVATATPSDVGQLDNDKQLK